MGEPVEPVSSRKVYDFSVLQEVYPPPARDRRGPSARYDASDGGAGAENPQNARLCRTRRYWSGYGARTAHAYIHGAAYGGEVRVYGRYTLRTIYY